MTEPVAVEQLLPCPFCGGVARIVEDDDPKYPWAIWSFHQDDCFLMHSNINRHRSYETEAEAIAAWNTRLAAIAQTKSPAVSEPVAWIVGDGSGTRYRTWVDGFSCGTFDRDQATRYARREDAEAVHREDEDAWSVQPYTHPAASERDQIVAWPREAAKENWLADPYDKAITAEALTDAADTLEQGKHRHG